MDIKYEWILGYSKKYTLTNNSSNLSKQSVINSAIC